MIIILSEKFCTLGYPNSCDPQVDEHYKFKSQRWQLISSLQCPRRNSNEISVRCFMSRRIGYKSSKTYTVCPWRYKTLIPSQRNKLHMAISKCFITKAKLSSSSEAAKHVLFPTPHNTGIYIFCGNN